MGLLSRALKAGDVFVDASPQGEGDIRLSWDDETSVVQIEFHDGCYYELRPTVAAALGVALIAVASSAVDEAKGYTTEPRA